MTEADKIIQNHFSFRGRTRNLPYYPRQGTRRDFPALFNKLGYKLGAEIGVMKGNYSRYLCHLMPELKMYCIDPWLPYQSVGNDLAEQRYQTALEVLTPYNATIIRKTSMDAVSSFEPASLDFIFIDGNHRFDYAMLDIIHWVPKVRIGGIIAVHDYHPWVGADVITAVEAYVRAHGINPWYVTREIHPSAFWVQHEDLDRYSCTR